MGGFLDSTCPEGITLLTNGTKTDLSQGQRSWEGRSSGMALSTASSVHLSNSSAIWPCHKHQDDDARRQWCSQFSVVPWSHYSARKIQSTIRMLWVLYCTSYLSQRSCASLISPSLKWVRISPKISVLFRNSIQAIPLWMKARTYFRYEKYLTVQT